MADKPEIEEIATTRDGRDITRGYILQDMLHPQDPLLVSRGFDYRIFEWVLQDDQVMSTFQQRRLSVVSREWVVEPGGTRAIDRKAADSLRAQLASLEWDRITDKMLFGLFYGFAIGECLWAIDGSEVVLDEIMVRKQRRFRFDQARRPRLLTQAESIRGMELPERKFWVYSCGADNDDDPYGVGLASWLYWPVWFKRNDIKFWLLFLEKFGQPTAKGEYQDAATDADARKRLLAACQAVGTDSAIIHPKGMEITLLEAARSGTADYATLHEKMDAAIAKIVLSQTMTTENGSSRAQGEVHERVQQRVAKADMDLVCSSFVRGPAAWLTDWNYPGAAVPRVYRRIEDEPDLKPQAERDKLIYDLGFEPSEDYVTATYGEGWTKRSPAPAAPVGAAAQAGVQPGTAAAAFALPDQDAIDGLVERSLDGWESTIDPLIAPIQRALDASSSYAEFVAKLPGLINAQDAAPLAERLGAAVFTARVAGEADALDD